ncbi:MAG: hypothetical protein WCF43_14815 [Steroidobacteraceae bacterium]
MRTHPIALVALGLSAVLGFGCAKEGPSPVDATTASSAATAEATASAPDAKQHVSACDMVTQAEMSAILGGAVTAAPGGNQRPPASTECIYSSVDGPAPIAEPQSYAEMQVVAGPYAELQVDWGGGDPQTLDTATGLAKGAAPTAVVDPLAGLGDRAYQVTADQVFISMNGDLMMIRFARGADDVIAKARKIYEIAQARM